MGDSCFIGSWLGQTKLIARTPARPPPQAFFSTVCPTATNPLFLMTFAEPVYLLTLYVHKLDN